MTNEEKQLLLKDLCARLPYGVKCNIPCEPHIATIHTIDTVYLDNCVIVDYSNSIDSHFPLEEIKPYLRPMSSMTEVEKKEYNALQIFYRYYDSFGTNYYYYYDTIKSIDWLNAHHFDYRELINNGLAIEASKEMYNIK